MLRLQYQKELAQSHVTVQTKFNYAWGLVKSPVREHQVEGVRLLQGMLSTATGTLPLMCCPPQTFTGQSPHDVESACIILHSGIIRWVTTQMRRVSMVGIPDYHRAWTKPSLSTADLLLEKEPTNLQAESLASLIELAITKGSCF